MIEADPLDVASENERIFTEAAIAAARRAPMIRATGYCLDPLCRELLIDEQVFRAVQAGEADLPENTPRWCSADCRDSWEREQKRGRQ